VGIEVRGNREKYGTFSFFAQRHKPSCPVGLGEKDNKIGKTSQGKSKTSQNKTNIRQVRKKRSKARIRQNQRQDKTGRDENENKKRKDKDKTRQDMTRRDKTN
jgi:hypothetical protein